MNLTLTLGVLLAAGALAGRVSKLVPLPKVTLYILAGLILGPSLLDWIPPAHLHQLDPVLKLALALVLFSLGSRFSLQTFRGLLHRVVPISLGELGCTCVLVSGGLFCLGEAAGPAILLGALALATAPATTLLVLREYDSEGSVTNYTYAMLALNNIAAIVLFELFFLPVSALGDEGMLGAGAHLVWLGIDLLGSLVVGVLGGLIVSFLGGQFTGDQRNLVVITSLMLMLGVCETLGIPYLLTFLAMGFTVCNTSEFVAEMVRELDRLGIMLYVVFFVAAGAELDLAALAAAGTVGAGYVVFRVLGKYLGVWAAASFRQEEVRVQRWLGCTLMAQAGTAIGLVQVAQRLNPELGHHLHSIIVGTVVVFEVLGPILVRLAIIRAGEVPLVHIVKPHSSGPTWREGLKTILDRLHLSVGQDPWRKRAAADLTVGDLMRRNVAALPVSAGFMEILEFIEHSQHQTYPIVSAAGEIVGVIRYESIRSAVFDPEVSTLVLAEDLSAPNFMRLLASHSLDEALRMFERTRDDVIPVVASLEKPTLVGLVERRDVVRVLKHRRANSLNDS